MKKTSFLAGIAFLITVVSVIGTVAADPIYLQINYFPGGNLWSINTDLSGITVDDIDVETLVATCFAPDPVIVTPQRIKIIQGELVLIFKPIDFPEGVLSTRVTGETYGGSSIFATGGALAWGRR